ncbi:unnamed protein product, partial [Prorocentrum cordatum]
DGTPYVPPKMPQGGRGASACHRCCHDGEKYAPCLDVDACAAQGPEPAAPLAPTPPGAPPAFVGDLRRPKSPQHPRTSWLGYIEAMRQQAEAHSIDILLVMPHNNSASVLPWHRECMEQYKIKLHLVDWTTKAGAGEILRHLSRGRRVSSPDVPPDARLGPFKEKGLVWSHGPRPAARLRLHRIRRRGLLRHRRGVPGGRIAHAAVRCERLHPHHGWPDVHDQHRFPRGQAVEEVDCRGDRLREADFKNETGWANAGFAPWKSKYVGAECGQGFLHTLFYKSTDVTRRAFEAAGLPGAADVQAAMLDVCLWNYQNHAYCPKEFDCGAIRVHHKPHPWKTQAGDCAKLSAVSSSGSEEPPRLAWASHFEVEDGPLALGGQAVAGSSILSDFEVVGKPLGRGSFGSVRKVVRKGTGEVFAMKAMSMAQILDLNLRGNVEREISTQRKARHPNILRLFEYFEDQESIYLLLEYAPNGSLLDLLKDCRRAAVAAQSEQLGLPETPSAVFFRDVAGALQFLHCSCVVHRDLKPENVLICAGGVAKLADFGWCNQLVQGANRSTFCGTSEYLSPEMIANEPHGLGVDVWAAGVLLFEMLVGRSPFAASHYVQVLIKISKVAYEFPGHVSEPARGLVGRLLVREPGRRLRLGEAAEDPWVREHIRPRAGPARPGQWQPAVLPPRRLRGRAARDGGTRGAAARRQETTGGPQIYEATARTIRVLRAGPPGGAPHAQLLADAGAQTPAGRGSAFSGASELSEGTWSALSCDRSSQTGLPGRARCSGASALSESTWSARSCDGASKAGPPRSASSGALEAGPPRSASSGALEALAAPGAPRPLAAAARAAWARRARSGRTWEGVAEGCSESPWSAPSLDGSSRAKLRSTVGAGIRERLAMRQRKLTGATDGVRAGDALRKDDAPAPLAEQLRGDTSAPRRRRATCPEAALQPRPAVHIHSGYGSAVPPPSITPAGAAWAAWAKAK